MYGPWTMLPITSTGAVVGGPGEFGGVVVNAAKAEHYVAVYDSLDADTGRLLGKFYGSKYVANPILPAFAIPFSRGLFMVLDDDGTEAVIVFRTGKPEG